MLYGYDALNRISNIHYGNGVETAYTYDGNGNHTAKTGTQATFGDIISGSNALDLSYVYDVRGQLLEERRNGASVCYAYDKAGNRIRKTDAQGEIRYLYNEKNQLVEEESPADRKQFSYDRQGGIIEEKNAAGIRRFSYNSRHQQTRVETETGNVQENRYDAEGLRFELLENGRRTSFVYHNGELLQEEGREEQGTSYHLWAGMEAFRRGQELSYYHRDEQLSTALVTDEHRNVQNSYQYDAFGMSLGTTEKLNNRIRYTGQQYDDVTGQYYLRARYYNPVAGRFMQEDVYQGDGLNLYAYCGNNPVVYDDPSGYKRKACPPQGKISERVDESGRNTATTINYSYKFDRELANFNDGYEIRTTVDKDLILVQYSSDAPDASLCYWTTVDEANRITTLNDYMDKLALSKDWGNRNTVKVARIPAGIEVKYAVGTAREQLLIADPRPGGGVQYLFNQFDTDWITEIRSFSN